MDKLERKEIINKFGREVAEHRAGIESYNRRSGDLKFDLLVLIDWMVRTSIVVVVSFMWLWWVL